MFILGIHDGHNASAALLKDGELIAAVQEERFTRVKNQGGLPLRAIEDVLAAAGITQQDIDVFAVADRYRYNQNWDRESILRQFGGRGQSTPRIWAGHLHPVRTFRGKQLLERRRRKLAEVLF